MILNFLEKIAMDSITAAAMARQFIKKRQAEVTKYKMDDVVNTSNLSKLQKTINPVSKKVNLSLEIPKTPWGKGYFKGVTPWI